MDFQDNETDEILNIFRQESTELLQSIDNCLLCLQKNIDDKGTLLILSRSLHSLKGAMRMLGFENIQTLAHKFEDIIIAIKDKKITLNETDIGQMVNILDYMSFVINKTIENKNEYFDSNLKKNVEKLEHIIKDNDINIEKPKNTTYTIKTAQAILMEIFLYHAKYKSTKNEEYIEEIKNGIRNLKNIFKSLNFSEGTDRLNAVIANSENTHENFDDEITKLQDVLNDYCLKSGIENINYKEGAKNQIEKIKKSQENIKPVKNLEVKQISANLDTAFTEPLKNLIELINSKNIETLKETADIITQLIEKTNNPDLKQTFYIISKIIRNFIYTNTIQEEIYQTLIWIITDILDMYEDVKTKSNDWGILLKRAQTMEQAVSFTETKPISKEQNKQIEPSNKGFSGQDWFDNITSTSIKTLRVESSKLDKLVNQTSELILTKIKITEEMTLMKKFQADLEDYHKNFHKVGDYIKYYDRKYLTNVESGLDIKSVITYNKQLLNFYTIYSEQFAKMSDELSTLEKHMQDNEAKLLDVSNELESMTKNLRILPLATIFHLFPRMVHNISQEMGKEIEFLIEGSDVSADKKIIEEVKLPLIHIIRNSIDHGIEYPKEREAKGKNPYGTIIIRAKHHENKIAITVKDDGRGIDLEKVKQTALSKGFVGHEEIKKYTNEQILDLIFSVGFSTCENITELSGRGLGLDIVKNKIAQLNGKINVVSKIDEGTIITIELPVAMATSNAFIISEDNQFFAIDTTSIQAVIQIEPNEIFEKDAKNYFVFREKVLPIFSLSQILQLKNTTKNAQKYTVMIIKENENSVGLIVDKLINDQEILQRKLSKPLLKVKFISGITTLASGDSCLILNVEDIMNNVESNIAQLKILNNNRLSKKDIANYKIFIVDDSFTTRMLEKSILKNAGYNVTDFSESKAALEELKNNKYDLIITDYDMPKMTGLELVKALRTGTDKNHKTPIIVLSSYAEAGLKNEFVKYNVERFIHKNEFNQISFLGYIQLTLLKNKNRE